MTKAQYEERFRAATDENERLKSQVHNLTLYLTAAIDAIESIGQARAHKVYRYQCRPKVVWTGWDTFDGLPGYVVPKGDE